VQELPLAYQTAASVKTTDCTDFDNPMRFASLVAAACGHTIKVLEAFAILHSNAKYTPKTHFQKNKRTFQNQHSFWI